MMPSATAREEAGGDVGRRLRMLVACVLVLVLAMPLSSAEAADLAKLKAQKAKLSAQMSAAGSAFRKALYKLEENEDRIAALEKRSKTTAKDLARAQANLQVRARTIYRMKDIDFVSVVLGATDFQELFTRMELLQSVVGQDAREVRDVKALRKRYSSEMSQLKGARKSLQKNASLMRQRRRTLTALMAQKQREYEAAKAELGAAASLVRSGYAPPGPNGMVFPVDGPCYYDDTWGAPRSGGRTHKGTDIMSAKGTPCVATCSGTISSKEGGLGGKVIYLDGDNGWRFYYAHLSGWAVRSGRVKAGQLIGYVGATGNAAGGAPHLHFQMWTSSGSIVDPYSYLKQMER
jgi:murein DD-endopeptidase MepM/ murein hydrolase activator NlpD